MLPGSPPMVIWDRKQLNLELVNGEVPGTIYGLSKSGRMDITYGLKDIFYVIALPFGLYYS